MKHLTRPRAAARLGAALALAASLALAAAPASATGRAADPTPAPSPAATSSDPKSPGTGIGGYTFGIQPAFPSTALPRPWFQYAIDPAGSVTDSVRVFNYTSKPLPLSIRVLDAYTPQDGGFAVAPSSEKPADAGSWVVFTRGVKDGKITVPARTRIDIPFSVTVPAQAPVGDHAAAIVVSYYNPSKDTDGNAVNIESRVGSRIYLRVNGDLNPSLTVDNLAASYGGVLPPLGKGRATVTYTVRNSGNVIQSGRQDVTITGPFGYSVTTTTPDLKAILPGGAVDVTVPFDEVFPAVRLNATVTVTPIATNADDPLAEVATVSVGFWAIPWTLIATIFAILLITYWFIRRRRLEAQKAASSKHGNGRPTGKRIREDVMAP